MSDSEQEQPQGTGTALSPAETEPLTAEQPAEAPRRGRGGMAVLAVLALGAGATALAWYDPLDWRGENTLRSDVTTLETRLGAAETAAKALESRLAQLESTAVTPGSLSALEQAVKANEAALTALQQAPGAQDEVSAVQVAAMAEAIEALKTQVAALSSAPGSTEEIDAAVDAAMAERAAAQEAEAKAAVEAARQQAARIEAVGRLQAAARNGAPFADLLPALDGLPVDPVLRDAASAGLVTQSALAEAFPDAARNALDAALRAQDGESMGDRLYTFLRIQTGARSLEPREGADPDAVLSRAEAAVQAGDVQMALDELAGLPPEGQAEMQAWSQMAQDWLAAQKALNDLSAAAGVQEG